LYLSGLQWSVCLHFVFWQINVYASWQVFQSIIFFSFFFFFGLFLVHLLLVWHTFSFDFGTFGSFTGAVSFLFFFSFVLITDIPRMTKASLQKLPFGFFFFLTLFLTGFLSCIWVHHHMQSSQIICKYFQISFPTWHQSLELNLFSI